MENIGKTHEVHQRNREKENHSRIRQKDCKEMLGHAPQTSRGRHAARKKTLGTYVESHIHYEVVEVVNIVTLQIGAQLLS